MLKSTGISVVIHPFLSCHPAKPLSASLLLGLVNECGWVSRWVLRPEGTEMGWRALFWLGPCAICGARMGARLDSRWQDLRHSRPLTPPAHPSLGQKARSRAIPDLLHQQPRVWAVCALSILPRGSKEVAFGS